MGVLKSCCCFTNVRSGSIACAVYSLVLSVISAGIVAFNLHIYELTNKPTSDLDIEALTQNLSAELNYIAINDSGAFGKPVLDSKSHLIYQSIFLSTLVINCLLFCTSVLLVIGISLDKRYLLLPWISVMACNIALDTGTLIYQTTLMKSLTFIIIEMVIWLMLTVLNIYCLLCVLSQYQELRSGRGTRDYVRRHSTRSYEPGIQLVHVNQGPIIINGHLPQAVTSTIRSNGMPNSGNSQVTATLLVSAPDYNVAAGQPPQYQETTQNGHVSSADTSVPLYRRTNGSDSPPPPYSSS